MFFNKYLNSLLFKGSSTSSFVNFSNCLQVGPHCLLLIQFIVKSNHGLNFSSEVSTILRVYSTSSIYTVYVL